MRNVVVDTNILIRALLKPDSSDGRVVRRVFDGELKLWYSEGLLYEFIRVLSYPRLKKFFITKERLDVFLELLVAVGILISPVSTKLCRDPDDNEVLGLALAASADAPVYLISADKDILALKGEVERVHILTPQEFLK